MSKKRKPKTVYLEDKGETIYSMAALNGRTPEEQEEFNKKRKNAVIVTGREKWAMIKAAFTVYGPILFIIIASFGIAALLLYLFVK
jgi:hypothetical protein